MPRSRLSASVRTLREVTGESRQRVQRRLRDGAPLIPAASPAQAELEHEVLLQLGKRGMTSGHGWKPGDDPFAVNWLSPYPDALDIGVKPAALPDVIGALLPSWYPDSEATGVAGLRAHLTPGGVELRRLGLPGVIRLPGISPARWWHAAAVFVGSCYDPGDLQLLWRTHPTRMHPEEQYHAQQHGAGYSSNPRPRRFAPLSSVLLRRHLIFRTVSTTCVDLWRNYESIELEWDNGPAHTDVIDRLIGPDTGVPGTIDKSCRCASGERCWGIALAITAAPGMTLHLRRCEWPWTDYRERDSEQSRSHRRAAMRRYWGSDPRTLAAMTAPVR